MDITRSRRIIYYGLKLRCPECGFGRLYRAIFRMEAHCHFCGLPFTREQGYFIGAIYLNVIATQGILLGTALVYIMTLHQFDRRLVMVLLVLCATLPLLFFHHSRSLWLAIDQIVDPQEPRTILPTNETQDWR